VVSLQKQQYNRWNSEIPKIVLVPKWPNALAPETKNQTHLRVFSLKTSTSVGFKPSVLPHQKQPDYHLNEDEGFPKALLVSAFKLIV
jgi:hypothetical protein